MVMIANRHACPNISHRPATSHPQIAPAEYATWIKTHDHIQPNTTKVQRQKSKLSASYRPQLKESSLTPESAGAVKAHRPTSELTDWRPTVSEIDSAENPPKNTCEEDLSRLHTAHIHPNARPALHRPVSAPPLSNPSSIPSTPASLTESAPTAPKIRRSLSERFSSSTQKTVSGIQWLKNIFSARKKIQSNQSIQSNQTENTEVTQKQGKKRGGLAAFFFPLVRKPSVQIEPSSTSCKMPVFTTGSRLATHVEHAIYHLSNRKLNSTNPRRSLHDQVLITNFMFWYRSVNRANVRSKYTNHQAMLYSRRRASAADVPPHHRPCATQPSRRKNDRYKPVPNIQYTKPIAPSPRKIPTRTKLSNDYGDYIINGEEDVLDIYYKNRISR
ncbi:hypothetical protein CLU79DRAFT_730503 [Phycomyces nitens]|nr:hypothetical protein CLU79DRAFT_730503 [Phycomyces nitens]